MLLIIKMILLKITKSNKNDKKYMAIFEGINGRKTVHFGSEGYSDFTIHKDEERKARYIARHKENENWRDPYAAGTLSRFILWNKPTLNESIKDYKKRFNL